MQSPYNDAPSLKPVRCKVANIRLASFPLKGSCKSALNSLSDGGRAVVRAVLWRDSGCVASVSAADESFNGTWRLPNRASTKRVSFN